MQYLFRGRGRTFRRIAANHVVKVRVVMVLVYIKVRKAISLLNVRRPARRYFDSAATREQEKA